MTDSKHPAGHVLQAFHDGELGSSEATSVAAHCEHCEHCQAELADLERMGRMLASDPAPELPRSAWPRVRPGRGRESRLRPVFVFTACAVGIILGILLGPIRFSAEETGTELARSEAVTVWIGGATSSLLSVYQSGQD